MQYASNAVWSGYERSGLTRELRDAGAPLISNTCPSITVLSDVIASWGFKSAATNSAKRAHYLTSSWGLNTHYWTTVDCIEAAVTGKWRE